MIMESFPLVLDMLSLGVDRKTLQDAGTSHINWQLLHQAKLSLNKAAQISCLV